MYKWYSQQAVYWGGRISAAWGTPRWSLSVCAACTRELLRSSQRCRSSAICRAKSRLEHDFITICTKTLIAKQVASDLYPISSGQRKQHTPLGRGRHKIGHRYFFHWDNAITATGPSKNVLNYRFIYSLPDGVTAILVCSDSSLILIPLWRDSVASRLRVFRPNHDWSLNWIFFRSWPCWVASSCSLWR